MAFSWFTRPRHLVLTAVLLLSVLIVACGGATEPEVREVIKEVEVTKEVVREVEKEVIKEVEKEVVKEVEKEVVKEVAKEVAVVVTATPGPTATPDTSAKPGGFINMQQYADVRQRLVHQSSILNMNLSPMMNLLVEYNPETDDTTDIRCDLCTSWDVSPDGMTYTFHLNQDAKWWDGNPVTSKDIWFAMESMVNPDQFEVLEGRSTSSTVNTELYVDTGATREIDTHTVEVKTKFPAAAFLAALAVETNAVQSYKTVVEDGIVQGGRDLSAINGSGAFKFVDYVSGVSVEYAKNEDYWKPGRPYINGMKHFIITDAGRAIAAYKTGQILMCNWITNLTALEAQKLDEEMDNLTVHFGGPVGWRAVSVNTTKAPFDDPNVRQAVHLALHRQPIIQATSGGMDTMGYMIPEGFWFSRTAEEYAVMPGYRELNGEKHPDDLAQAQQLLVQAGVPEGIPIQITARNCCGYPDQAVLVKEQLQDRFGWDIEIRVMEAGAGFDAYWAGDFQMMVQGHGFHFVDPDSLMVKWVRGTLPQWLGGGRGKFWTITAIEDLYYQQQQETDLEKRKAMVHEMARIAQEEGSANYPIYWGLRNWAVEHRIQNYHFEEWGKKWEHIWCDPAC